MTPDNVDPLVITFLQAEFAKLNSKNKLEIENLHGGKPWVYVVSFPSPSDGTRA